MRRVRFARSRSISACISRVGLEQIGEDRKRRVADVLQRALADVEVEHGEKFSVRPGVGDQGLAAGIGDQNRARHGVMGMAAENDVDAGDSGWRA